MGYNQQINAQNATYKKIHINILKQLHGINLKQISVPIMQFGTTEESSNAEDFFSGSKVQKRGRK